MGSGSREPGFKHKLSLTVKPSKANPDIDKRGLALDSEKHCLGLVSALFHLYLLTGSITHVLIIDHIPYDWVFWVEMSLSFIGLCFEYLLTG